MNSYCYKRLGSNGRLGNQLWQIAWQIGSAAKRGNGSRACVNPDWAYRKYFSLEDNVYDPPPNRRIIDGSLYYQELHHWDNIPELIHEYFQPSQLSVEYLKDNYPAWFFDDSVDKTSVHIRAGDYLDWPKRFPVPTENYYRTAITNAGPNTRLVVFSDDINFAKAKLNDFSDNIVFIDGVTTHADPSRRNRGEPQDQWDLFLMTLCNKHIIANSTFSWWGAFLANSEAIYYPSVWFGPDVDAKDSRGIDVKESWVDAIPEDWKEVQC